MARTARRPLAKANPVYMHRRFAGCVLVSDQESWIGTAGPKAVTTEWQESR